MNTTKLSLLLEQYKIDYTKSEKKLYEYVINNFEKVMYHSLTELAEICQVGEATILRFCRKLGYEGYQDFKLAVAQDLSTVTKNSGDETYVEKIKNNMIEAIADTYNIIDLNTLEDVIDKINLSNDVVVYGIGLSGIVALDMKSRFLRIGKNISVVTDPHFQMMRSCSTNKDTVIIAISLSGSTKDIVDAVKVAKNNGAFVMAITSHIKSPLTKYSDLVLLTSGKENPLDSGSLVAKISQIFVIDLICTGVTMKNYENAKKFKAMTAEAVSNKLY
ncbi:MurR/RpiR family transcriptional regulator [Natronincola ferrireducens]|uniref:Transcriptional regulator, RpiR family n=1 Tax=Natronincola ferrireducens TaxID=393762 RepID=A0A1G9A6R0_9FIRM|nr:MurR/RpiR family transcriptional regulator [Natronincola ferrireducens]SDK22911.1 transcriptional regulator, RpiR family [Natronincola ferrireducens]